MKFRLIIFLILLSMTTFGKLIRYTFNQQCKKATEIFIGRIFKMTVLKEGVPDRLWSYRTFEIKFVTEKAWKGIVRDTMTCIASEGICSPNYFELEKEYLVFSEKGEIELGSGRSGNVQLDFVRSDMTKLTIRYLFRRPRKYSGDIAMTVIGKPRQPITAAQASAGLFLYLPPRSASADRPTRRQPASAHV